MFISLFIVESVVMSKPFVIDWLLGPIDYTSIVAIVSKLSEWMIKEHNKKQC